MFNLDPKLIKIVEEVWDEYDKDGNDYLDNAEYQSYINDIFKKAVGSDFHIDEEMAENIKKDMDIDHDGNITREELYRSLRKQFNEEYYDHNKE